MATKTDSETSLLESLIRGTYDSLKYPFQILMMYSLLTAAHTCYPSLIESISAVQFSLFNTGYDQSVNQPKVNLVPIFLLIVVFIPAFVRFFIGDLRYLDLSYIDLASVAKNNGRDSYREEIRKFSGKKRFFDVLMLLTHGVLFLFLGKSLDNISNCASIYTLLMLVNILWLSFSITRTEKYKINDDDNLVGVESILIQYSRRNWAPQAWIYNNLAFLALVFITFLFFRAFSHDLNNLFYWFFVGFVILNSVIDFKFTWFFYFPDYEKILDHETDPPCNPDSIKDAVSKFSTSKNH